MRAVAIALVMAGVGVGHADPSPSPTDPLAAGKALATERRFKEAIARFKEARKADATRSDPDCFIALSYRRLERWGQAKLFLARCLAFEQRPDWVATLATDVETGIAQAVLTPVHVAVTPDAPATITVASFAPDEAFSPQTIYLEPGEQLFTIQAPGYKTQKLTVELTSAAPRDIAVALEPLAITPPVADKPAPMLAPAPTKPHDPPGSSTAMGKRVLFVSAGVLGVGIVAHVLTAITRSDAVQSAPAYDDLIGRFRVERAVTVTAYSFAAIGTGIGLWMVLHTSKEQRLAHRHVVPAVSPGGAGVAWIGTW